MYRGILEDPITNLNCGCGGKGGTKFPPLAVFNPCNSPEDNPEGSGISIGERCADSNNSCDIYINLGTNSYKGPPPCSGRSSIKKEFEA